MAKNLTSTNPITMLEKIVTIMVYLSEDLGDNSHSTLYVLRGELTFRHSLPSSLLLLLHRGITSWGLSPKHKF